MLPRGRFFNPAGYPALGRGIIPPNRAHGALDDHTFDPDDSVLSAAIVNQK
jgi:hypothetical protein